MEIYDIIAQGFGLLGMAMNILSYQRRERGQIIFMQLFGAVFFSINYFLLGAYVGALLNFVAMARAVVYWKGEKLRSDKPIWIAIIGIASILVYALSFAVFKTEPSAKKLITEALPVLAMILSTVSFYLGSARAIRRFGIINSPLWLTYNIINFAIGGIITEVISLVSIIIGIIRYDLRRGGKAENDNRES